MGFGHRVYKNFDPRAKLIRQACHELLQDLDASNQPLFEIALELEEGRTLLSGLTASVDIEVEPFFDVVGAEVPAEADAAIGSNHAWLFANPAAAGR